MDHSLIPCWAPVSPRVATKQRWCGSKWSKMIKQYWILYADWLKWSFWFLNLFRSTLISISFPKLYREDPDKNRLVVPQAWGGDGRAPGPISPWNRHELDELWTWSPHPNTLAQNGHCELWSGMYLTCKNSKNHLNRVDGLLDGNPHARSECLLKIAKRNKPDYNDRTWKDPSNQIRQSRQGGSWVSHSPCLQKKVDSRYVELIRLHITTNWQCLRWSVFVSRALPPCKLLWNSFQTVPLQTFLPNGCKIQNETERSFTSVQMVHTHTHKCILDVVYAPEIKRPTPIDNPFSLVTLILNCPPHPPIRHAWGVFNIGGCLALECEASHNTELKTLVLKNEMFDLDFLFQT